MRRGLDQCVLGQEGSSREVPPDPPLPAEGTTAVCQHKQALPSQHDPGEQVSLPGVQPHFYLSFPALPSVSEYP